MVHQTNKKIQSGSGLFGSFDLPWSERSRIDLFSKEMKNPFSDSFRFKNPVLDFLKKNAPLVKQMHDSVVRQMCKNVFPPSYM